MTVGRYFFTALTLALCIACKNSAAETTANYPSKPVTLSVGFPPGQMTDLLTRVLAERLTVSLGQTVVVENKPGQGGSIALARLARAKPDGYELMLSPTAALVINPALYDSISYDTLNDFTPIAKVAEVPFVLVASSQMPFDDVAGMIEYAKKNRLTYTSPGNGTLPHLGMILFQKKTGTKLTHIPYKGSPRAMSDLASGLVDVGFDTEVVTKPFVESKRMKILAVTGDSRLASLPDVPTIKESGVSDFELVAWFGIVAPKNTPSNIVSLIDASVKQATSEKQFIQALGTTGATPSHATSDELSALMVTELAKWKSIVKESAASVD
ncbi:tripartite tricarboxylate transporter substrate binding protein [Pusillimonas sp. TS35]|nr:tripartite tricarboxylate transporter substrate binding protein [Pusillimonas sp. TS35]